MLCTSRTVRLHLTYLLIPSFRFISNCIYIYSLNIVIILERTERHRSRALTQRRARIPDKKPRWYECQSIKVQPANATNQTGLVGLAAPWRTSGCDSVLIRVPDGERTTALWALILSICVGMTCGRKDGKARIRRRALCDSERKRKKGEIMLYLTPDNWSLRLKEKKNLRSIVILAPIQSRTDELATCRPWWSRERCENGRNCPARTRSAAMDGWWWPGRRESSTSPCSSSWAPAPCSLLSSKTPLHLVPVSSLF